MNSLVQLLRLVQEKISFIEWLKEFLGLAPYQGTIEPYHGWQHLLIATLFLIVVVALSVTLGLKNKHCDEKTKFLPIRIVAPIMLVLEAIKIVLWPIKVNDIRGVLTELPLFLCSIQLFTVPFIAWMRPGKFRDACADFVLIWGLLTAVLQFYFAGNMFGQNQIFSYYILGSMTTHAISGFVSLYVGISGIAKMNKKDAWIPILILVGFEIIAETVNLTCNAYFKSSGLNYYVNYMFLDSGDGTPFDIVRSWFGNYKVPYVITVATGMCLYMVIYDTVFMSFRYFISQHQLQKEKAYVKI